MFTNGAIKLLGKGGCFYVACCRSADWTQEPLALDDHAAHSCLRLEGHLGMREAAHN